MDGSTESARPPGVSVRLYRLLIHGSVLLGAVTVAKVVAAATLLGVDPGSAVVVGFLLPLGIYNLNNLTDADEDAVNAAGRHRFVRRRRFSYAGASAAAVLVGLAVAAGAGADGLLLALVPLVAAAGYSVRWLPVTTHDRLKDVPLLSTAVIATAWAVPVVYLPLAFADAGPPLAAVLVVALFVCRTVIAAEVRNVQDLVGDRRAGVVTLPHVIGVPATRRVCYALDACSLLLLVVGVAAGAFQRAALLAFLPALALSLFVVSRTREGADLRHLCTVRDLEYPLFAALLVAAVGW